MHYRCEKTIRMQGVGRLRAALCRLLAVALIACSLAVPAVGCASSDGGAYRDCGSYDLLGDAALQDPRAAVDLAALPAFDGSRAVDEINGGTPGFAEGLLGCTASFESYAPLDELGRCGAALACIGPDLLCDDERGSIGMVRPTGWQIAKYDFIDGAYLYNRCHLIAFMLAGENANELNLITGTRYLNVQGMLPYETLVHDYVAQTGNHVLYRVTPLFESDNLLATGVQLEGWSVEDGGAGVRFNVFAYNCQPGVSIDYGTGANAADPDWTAPVRQTAGAAEPTSDTAAEPPAAETAASAEEPAYILNTNTHKFHYPWCASVDDMSEKNKQEFFGTSEEAQALGYAPCKRCNP